MSKIGSDPSQTPLGGNSGLNLFEGICKNTQIENQLHWVLDVSFDEDTNRVRRGNGQANLAVLRHIALNLLRKEKSFKAGIKNKGSVANNSGRLNVGRDGQSEAFSLHS